MPLKLTGVVVRLAWDLASFYCTEPEDAIAAIDAALCGDPGPIRSYGVLLDDSFAERAYATEAFAEILAQASDARGDFERTVDGIRPVPPGFYERIADRLNTARR